MRNKRIVKKRSNKIKFHETLEKKIRMIIKKSLYDSLMLRPIVRPLIFRPFQNLVNVTLQECKFNFLPPKEFGTLHHLQEITLCRNYVVNTIPSVWEWLKQAPVNSNLKLLKIKNYDLFKLPLQITCLKNLRTLIMTGNKIVSLPKEFGNLPLLDLDLSYNNLGRSKQPAWEWLMQAPIRNNLRTLNLKHNYIIAIPLQINCLKNLQVLFLCDNLINFLPKGFGTLSQLRRLYLSKNLLETYPYTTWKWLEAPIKDNLLLLDIHDNCLTELPPQIEKLNALKNLNLSVNELKYLPQSLVNLKNLEVLDLENNDLLYLPGSMAHLSADIYVKDNPFNLKDDSNVTTNSEVPSLMECSADVILKSGLNYINVLSQAFVRYLDTAKYCFFCGIPCFHYYEKRFIKFSEYRKILNIKLHGTRNMYINFECYACSSECAKKLRN